MFGAVHGVILRFQDKRTFLGLEPLVKTPNGGMGVTVQPSCYFANTKKGGEKITFSHKTQFEAGAAIHTIANKYELSGGSITNVVRYASMQALKQNDTIILQKNVLSRILKELGKEGKIVSEISKMFARNLIFGSLPKL